MPIYEYKCQKCGEHFEKRQSVSDEPLKTCENCGGDLEKQWSLSGFQFKGAGWYVTDYSKKNSEKSEKPPTGESTEKSGPASNSTGEKASSPTKEAKKE
jgi:putative FmdB family regulatory protein